RARSDPPGADPPRASPPARPSRRTWPRPRPPAARGSPRRADSAARGRCARRPSGSACFASPSSPLNHVEAEAAGGALDRLDRRLQAGRRQVGHLDACDLLDLLAGHLAHLLLPLLAVALLDTRGAL